MSTGITDELHVTLTVDEAVTILAAIKVAKADVTQETAEAVVAKLDAAIEAWATS